MSVSITGIEFVKPSQVLYSNPGAIESLVREIILSMTEASIDMICDGGPSEYPNKQTIEDCLSSAADMGVDFVNDAVEELREKLIKRLQEVKVKPVVKAIHFDEKGYSDVAVDIELV
jgi:hypothetical protein